MKKSFLYSMMAMFAMSFASCSQEEIVSTEANGLVSGPVTVSVNIPQNNPISRAMPEVDGFTRRCIMQLVDGEGAAIADQKYVQEVTGDNVTFSFTAPEEAYQCVFWADYVQVGAEETIETAPDWVYNTTALPAITYQSNRDRHFTDAADAFCGVLDPSSSTSTTLTRPLTRIDLGAEDPAEFEGYTTIAVGRFNIPGGYDIFTGTTNTTTVQEIRLDARAMDDAEAGEWASLFVFAPVDQTEFATSMTLTVSGDGVDDYTATIESLTLDANMIVDMGFTPGEQPGSEMDVTVSFGDEFENQPAEPVDPNAPLAVGDYINTNGEKVATAEEAIAVVFALGGQNDNSTYAEGKTVEAYAMSLNKATNRNIVGTYTDLSLAVTDDAANAYAGLAFSTAIETALGTASDATAYQMFNSFFNNSLVEATASENLSEWYIPSLAQLQAALATTNADLIAALKAAYTGNYYCASSTVTAEGLQGIIYNITDGTSGSPETIGTGASAVVFPVVTIFE